MYKKLAILSLILFCILLLTRSKHELQDYVYLRCKKNMDHYSPNILLNMDNDNFFMYNPSIQWDGDGKNILVISRVSGHVMIPRLKTCLSRHVNSKKIDIKSIDGLSGYFDMFGKYREGSSGIISYKIPYSSRDTLEKGTKLINPFFRESNLATEKYQGFEDPRVFSFQNMPWIICYFRGKNFPYRTLVDTSKFGHYIVIFPIDMSRDPILLDYRQRKKIEKNWMPFQYEDNLYIVYSIFPHKILSVDLDSGLCTDVYETKSKSPFLNEIGNGAPPVFFEKGDCMLGIAHIRGSIEGEMTRKNFFYLFQKSPPFSIISVSNIFNLAKPFVNIEFASGLLVDGDNILISYGVDDCYGSIISLSWNEVKHIFPKIYF